MDKLVGLTRNQRALIEQVCIEGAAVLPWNAARTVRSLFKRGLVSYHSQGGRWIVVPAGEISFNKVCPVYSWMSNGRRNALLQATG
jgi:hypothetical protein